MQIKTRRIGWLVCLLYCSLGLVVVLIRNARPVEAIAQQEHQEWISSLRYTLTDLGPLSSIPYYRLARSQWDQPQRLSAEQVRSLLLATTTPFGQADAQTSYCRLSSRNRHGQSVSFACRLHPTRGCIHTTKGHFALQALGGKRSVACDVNDAGRIVGYATDQQGASHAVLWEQNGKPHDLGTLGGPYSYAHAINESGDIVGAAEVATGQLHAFLYRNGAMIDLGAPGDESGATSINAVGQVVGYTSAGNTSHQAAFLWDQGRIADLNILIGDPRWHLNKAWEITACGQILGEGVFNGKVHAFLLTPE
jgi:probable HAF family extracellular repeat protein